MDSLYWKDLLKPRLHEQFLCDNFYLLVYIKKIDQFLYDNYICWKTGLLVFTWQIKIVTNRKLSV